MICLSSGGISGTGTVEICIVPSPPFLRTMFFLPHSSLFFSASARKWPPRDSLRKRAERATISDTDKRLCRSSAVCQPGLYSRLPLTPTTSSFLRSSAMPAMARAVDEIGKLRQKADTVAVKGNREYNPGWSTALDLHNLLTVSEAVARSAMLRKESRGGHFRADFEKKSDEWSKKNIVLKKGGDGSMQISTAPIKEMPAELKAIIESEAK